MTDELRAHVKTLDCIVWFLRVISWTLTKLRHVYKSLVAAMSSMLLVSTAGAVQSLPATELSADSAMLSEVTSECQTAIHVRQKWRVRSIRDGPCTTIPIQSSLMPTGC